MDHQHQSMATPTTTSMCSKNKSKKQQGGGGGERSSRGSGCGGNGPPAAMRKGPWTEEEDAQLVWFVRLFGERRWDFLAKVSGLRRTGKSCRLRWVNYLHPGLRRGRITADEERRIVELHAQWGSRWSRIARSLPGRTDNEIKNFWRTRARKQKAAAAQQNSRSSNTAATFSGSSSSVTATTTTSSCCGSPSPSSGGCGTATTSSSAVTESALRQNSSSGGENDDEASTTTAASQQHQHHHQQQCYASDDHFWNDIAAAEAASYTYMLIDGWEGAGPDGHPAAVAEPPSSPTWEYCSDYSLWRIDDDEYYKKMLDSS